MSVILSEDKTTDFMYFSDATYKESSTFWSVSYNDLETLLMMTLAPMFANELKCVE